MFYSLMNTPARQERWLEIRKGKTEQKRGKHSERERERVNRKQEHYFAGMSQRPVQGEGIFNLRHPTSAPGPALRPRPLSDSTTQAGLQNLRQAAGGPLEPRTQERVCVRRHTRERMPVTFRALTETQGLHM